MRVKTKLFRAKSVDTGEWIFGYYACARDYLDEETIHHIMIPINTETYFPSSEIHYEEIDPETVTQSINSLDRNEKIMFEGEIAHSFGGGGHRKAAGSTFDVDRIRRHVVQDIFFKDVVR